MNTQVLQGLLVPFLGTTLGAALVFFLKRDLPEKVQKGLSGFAAGVMVAASIWSLLIPALEGAADLGAWSFLPATIGFWLGILFLLLLDRLVPHVHLDGEQEGLRASLPRSMMVALAVALHNLPEGMAVGVVYAGSMQPEQLGSVSFASAFALAIGIANNLVFLAVLAALAVIVVRAVRKKKPFGRLGKKKSKLPAGEEPKSEE
jgi:ZIP family zinc transporter